MAQYTCERASVPDSLTSSCKGVVRYPAAARFTNFSSGYGFDSDGRRETEATVTIDFLATSQVVGNRECLDATKAYVCTEAFPYCPYPSGGISYLPACRDACERVKRACGTQGAELLDCSVKPATGGSCFSLPPDGSFSAQETVQRGCLEHTCASSWLGVLCSRWSWKVCRVETRRVYKSYRLSL